LTRGTRGADAQAPRSVTPDGKWLLVAIVSPTTGSDLNLVPLEGEHRTQPLLHAAFNEGNGEISPDGRWLAYQSDESGRVEVYVRPFPDVDKGHWQVSTDGGFAPRWSRDRRELFFSDPANVVAAAVRVDGSTFAAGKPVVLFPRASYGSYDVGRDGRFLVIKFGTLNQQQQIVIVQNWLEELKARVTSK